MTMMQPGSEDELVDSVRRAAVDRIPLAITGAGTKRGIHGPLDTRHALSLAGLSGILLYEPDELVLSARAGTRLSEIEAALAARHQHLGFEVPDYAALFGTQTGCQTMGGIVAANLAGPRRIAVGAARDHLLGFKAVNGRAEMFKSGGRVVKNVTGYDLCKLMAGSWGTLALMTEVTVKVLPRPETSLSLVIPEQDPGRAVGAMIAALQSPQEVSAAAWVPATLARLFVGDGMPSDTGGVVLRVEGTAASVAFRKDAVRRLYAAPGDLQCLDEGASTGLWAQIRDASLFAGQGDRVLWRISLPPTATASLLAALPGMAAMLDWGGGLVWLQAGADDPSLDRDPDAGAGLIRPLVARLGGSATLFRAPAEIRARLGTLDPPGPALGGLIGRVKAAFDPLGLFNPGRLYPTTVAAG